MIVRMVVSGRPRQFHRDEAEHPVLDPISTSAEENVVLEGA